MLFRIIRNRHPWAHLHGKGSGTRRKKCLFFGWSQVSTIPKENISVLYWIYEILAKRYTRFVKPLTPFLQLLKTTNAKAKTLINPGILKQFWENNKMWYRCCQLAPRRPLRCKQLVIKTDASFQTAGYAVLLKDDPNHKYKSMRKTAPTAYGSKTYTPSQIKMFIYTKTFLALYLASKENGHVIWRQLNQCLSGPTANQLPDFSNKNDSSTL